MGVTELGTSCKAEQPLQLAPEAPKFGLRRALSTFARRPARAPLP